MSSSEVLRKALEWFDEGRDDLTPGVEMVQVGSNLLTIVEVARMVLHSEVIWLCQQHKASGNSILCWAAHPVLNPDDESCRMVAKVVVGPDPFPEPDYEPSWDVGDPEHPRYRHRTENG